MTRILAAALLAVVAFAGAAQSQESRTPAAPAAAAATLNLNTATVTQLEALPGIGKSTAERIIEYRQKSGGFKKIEELMNVRGIGEKMFLRLKPLISVAPPKTEKASGPQ